MNTQELLGLHLAGQWGPLNTTERKIAEFLLGIENGTVTLSCQEPSQNEGENIYLASNGWRFGASWHNLWHYDDDTGEQTEDHIDHFVWLDMGDGTPRLGREYFKGSLMGDYSPESPEAKRAFGFQDPGSGSLRWTRGENKP